ncbi:metallophosphoesterase family protein [uncultured Sphingomonas sp.]|uniref:metallophosphoesterase family protein n=1 Tax=uncultured Sphingomonas sp. TaxID=158754 RepID=UPI0035CAA997
MFARFLKSIGRADANRDALPAGVRAYAVGDIHGRLDLLDDLIGRIDADDAGRKPADTTIVFLGDLIDRGPDSAGVVERLRLLAASGRRVRLLAGNHEELLLQVLKGDIKALKVMCRVGGRATALSYGMDDATYDQLDFEQLSDALSEMVPDSHRRFLASFEDIIMMGDYLFVHAGVRPDQPLHEQRPSDLRWIRGPFLDHGGRLAKRVVHGHTIAPEVQFRPHRIGIDTGAYASGRLTALGLQDVDQWLLQTG